MSRLTINKILVDEESFNHGLTHRILGRLSGIPVHAVGEGIQEREGRLEQKMGKETLCLLCHKGKLLKPCPGTKEYICCGYQILNVAANCPLDCSYCVLQSYLTEPGLKVFVNVEEKLDQVLNHIDNHPDKIFRIGTGEFTDSLALDPLVGWSGPLFSRLTQRKNAVLELKTKTGSIERLLAFPHRDRIVVSWSLNSPYVALKEEHRAASLKKRLEAARLCQSEGFTLGFHFDPLIFHPRWKEEYLKTLDLMDSNIDPKGIIWISLGSFRFMPALKAIIRKRHPETEVLDGEFILGLDGKMRYFKPLRIDLYASMRENLEKWSQDLGLYLCMESDDIWKKSLGWSPGNSTGLGRYLDNRVIKFFCSIP
jgi:spore photoproduct lyase